MKCKELLDTLYGKQNVQIASYDGVVSYIGNVRNLSTYSDIYKNAKDRKVLHVLGIDDYIQIALEEV